MSHEQFVEFDISGATGRVELRHWTSRTELSYFICRYLPGAPPRTA